MVFNGRDGTNAAPSSSDVSPRFSSNSFGMTVTLDGVELSWCKCDGSGAVSTRLVGGRSFNCDG